jgi:hypothetical protein
VRNLFDAGQVVAQRTALLVIAQVADGVSGANQRHGGGKKNDQRAERIDIEETVTKQDGARGHHLGGQRDSGQKDDAEPGHIHHFHGLAPAHEK